MIHLQFVVQQGKKAGGDLGGKQAFACKASPRMIGYGIGRSERQAEQMEYLKDFLKCWLVWMTVQSIVLAVVHYLMLSAGAYE